MTDTNAAAPLLDLRKQLRQRLHADEQQCVQGLLDSSATTDNMRKQAQRHASKFVVNCRADHSKHNILDAFLLEFSLSNQEGIALMCLAEALLRIPDKDTADALINEKISSGDWGKHFRKSDSNLVNVATVGLMLTGGFVRLEERFSGNPVSWLPALSKKVGEPMVRQAIRQAMGVMGGQYVLGRSIDEAHRIGHQQNRENTRFSFDMLGEGARTYADAQKYFKAYLAAIESIGALANGVAGDSVIEADGISVKLSALHPRYHYSHQALVLEELFPLLKQLANKARQFNIGFTIDAEESERLDISLELFEALVRDPDLTDWDGMGLVVQGYQKRAPLVIEWLATLARETERKLMVRLVKGAYWDREIKFAQERGYPEYPVYTRKRNTDLSYQVCAALLLDANDVLFPQFATHNAHTVAIVWEMIAARPGVQYEFQRLHGMGDLLYGEVDASDTSVQLPMRVYAPVGAHKDLLPYLVRRLLENGANSSFVNQFLDKNTPIEEIVADPVSKVRENEFYRHPNIPLPLNIFRSSDKEGRQRDNSKGLDLDNPAVVEQLFVQMQAAQTEFKAGPLVSGKLQRDGEVQQVQSAVDRQLSLGSYTNSTQKNIDDALSAAQKSQLAWDRLGGVARAEILTKVGDLLEQNCAKLMWLISHDAGRVLPDALSEVREAVDFCRYYALKASQHFGQPIVLPGPTGEANTLSLHGRGTFLCISPWNFPLAIFVGQITAALAAGNAVIAKPAEQTSLVAFAAIELFHQAGVPHDVLHLLMGTGSEVGPKLVNDQRISGVCFTGSTGVAKLINRQLAERDGAIVPLIAETGGQNAMLVDSSALPEQVVDDVIESSFNSAGQRCSALRVLYLQEEVADQILEMLIGATDALHLGDPSLLATDIGPVIDATARSGLEQHLAAMQADPDAEIIARFDQAKVPVDGTFFAPTIIQLKSITQLKSEVFGPILHVIRYRSKQLQQVLDDLNQTGFGLTLGVHSRREEFAETIYANTHVGNTYINRNVVGAVVGVQPFGGQGLSGTGPKAGGPHYLFRFATEKTRTTNLVATGGDVSLLNLS